MRLHSLAAALASAGLLAACGGQTTASDHSPTQPDDSATTADSSTADAAPTDTTWPLPEPAPDSCENRRCFRAITCRKGDCNGAIVSMGCCGCAAGAIDDVACSTDAGRDGD